ncbi:uncharacterized protein OCT59_022534 [Rhizophagus irregularis]|uniref:uncharacterized protein n=1 Tax=Rhizophagus irregularis TaxID=588596 RepID=UPI000CB49AC3|nr:hypothetical protein OCT59_022534 [Rhizophagus irregularis]GET67419.1 mating-type m-specific polypeptide mc 2 [Rhizophagus irregularis DAOM 181602=DAOM 197198]CAG8463229.1 23245_t:CDS:1 [Rhizophagus irregularis]
MPKVNTNLQITRVNRRNNTDKNSSNGIKTTSELLLGLKAEHIPLPDTQYIKRILENSRRAKSKKNDPPRPPNAFFLFRNALNSHLATRNLKVPQISMAAGELWGTASEEIKNHYTKLQEIAKVLHLEMHPGYVYRPRKNFPTPNPPIHSSDKNSSESLTSTTTSLSPSISEPSTSTKFITSRLAQLSFIKHNQINIPSLNRPNSSFSFNGNIFTPEHNNNRNQELPEFHQIFANNNTPKIPQVFSQQRQFVPTRLIRTLTPVPNQSQGYHDINNHFARHQFISQQQRSQIDPVLITTLTSVTTLPVNMGHINSTVASNTSNDIIENQPTNPAAFNVAQKNSLTTNGLDLTMMTQQGCHYRRQNEAFNDWINWNHF